MGILINKRSTTYGIEQHQLNQLVAAFPGFAEWSPAGTYTTVEAIKNTDIFTAVTMIAGDLARMDIEVRENDVHNANNPIAKLLNVRPNNLYNGYILKFITFANTLLTGHGYLKIHRANNQPISLEFCKTSTIELIKADDGDLIYKRLLTSGEYEYIAYEDMIDIKFYTLDGFKGISLTDTLTRTIDTDNYGKSFLTNFLRNGTHAGGILKMKGVLNNKEARDRAKESFEESFSGSKKAGSVLVLDESMTYDQLEIDTSIIKLIQDNKASTREIAGVFGIPLHKFGIETTNMSITDANLDYLSTLAPYMKAITSSLEFYFNDSKKDNTRRFKFDTTELRVVDAETQANIDSIHIDKAIKTLDEVRASLGLPPLPNGVGSKHRVDLNHVNIEVVDEYQLQNTDKKHLSSTEGGD